MLFRGDLIAIYKMAASWCFSKTTSARFTKQFCYLTASGNIVIVILLHTTSKRSIGGDRASTSHISTLQYISHLRRYKDIMVEFLQELSEMLNSLNDCSRRVGLLMFLDETKVIFTAHVNPGPVKYVRTYVDMYISTRDCTKHKANLMCV